jgi:hypothetical protein
MIKNMNLIARWTKHQDASDEPHSVLWQDGRSATPTEYEDHRDDTYLIVHRDDGCTEVHYFPDLVVEVIYDQVARQWAAKGRYVESFGLGITDPHATDSQIIAEICTFPVIYRHRICR